MFTRKFAIDLAERVLFTFLQAYASGALLNLTGVMTLDGQKALVIAAGAATLSALKGLLASRVGDETSASAVL